MKTQNITDLSIYFEKEILLLKKYKYLKIRKL